LHTAIKPQRGLAQLELGEVWQARELLAFFAWRDIVVRYKQTSIGVLWAFIRPFLTMVIFTVVFGRIAKLPSDGVPYAVFTFTALLPWQQRGEREHRIRHPIRRQLGDPPEDDGKDDHRQKRPDERPQNADRSLLVADDDVAPGEERQQLPRLPDLSQLKLREPALGLNGGVQGVGVYPSTDSRKSGRAVLRVPAPPREPWFPSD